MGNSSSPEIQQKQNTTSAGMSKGLTEASDALVQNAKNVPLQQILGFNPYQQQVMSQFQNFLSTPQQSTTMSNQYLADVLSGKYLDPASNPSLSASADAITGGAQRYLNKNLDELNSGFALAGGASSSALANAKSRSAVDSSTGLAQALAGLYGNAYSQERGLQSGAVGQGLQLAQMPYQQFATALGMGGQQYDLANAQANLPYQNWSNRQAALVQALGGAGGAMKDINSTFYTPQYAPSELQQNLGLAFQGANALGNLGGGAAKAYMAFSDRRLKTDVVRIGAHRGLGLYRFRYKPGFGLPSGEHVGVMADEVLKIIPRAVKAVQGFLCVNYSLLIAEAF